MTRAKISAWINGKEESFPSMKEGLFSYIKQHPGCTLKDLERAFNRPYHRFSGRVTDLLDDGQIYEIENKLKGYSEFYLTRQENIDHRRILRRNLKLEAFIRRGEKEFPELEIKLKEKWSPTLF